MRMLRGMAIAGALALATGGCASMRNPFYLGFRPGGCPVYQARAWRTTSIMGTRQRVQQIQAKYSISAGAHTSGSVSKDLVSGECR